MPIKYSTLQRANLALQVDFLVIHAISRANRFSTMLEFRERDATPFGVIDNVF